MVTSRIFYKKQKHTKKRSVITTLNSCDWTEHQGNLAIWIRCNSFKSNVNPKYKKKMAGLYYLKTNRIHTTSKEEQNKIVFSINYKLLLKVDI